MTTEHFNPQEGYMHETSARSPFDLCIYESSEEGCRAASLARAWWPGETLVVCEDDMDFSPDCLRGQDVLLLGCRLEADLLAALIERARTLTVLSVDGGQRDVLAPHLAPWPLLFYPREDLGRQTAMVRCHTFLDETATLDGLTGRYLADLDAGSAKAAADAYVSRALRSTRAAVAVCAGGLALVLGAALALAPEGRASASASPVGACQAAPSPIIAVPVPDLGPGGRDV